MYSEENFKEDLKGEHGMKIKKILWVLTSQECWRKNFQLIFMSP